MSDTNSFTDGGGRGWTATQVYNGTQPKQLCECDDCRRNRAQYEAKYKHANALVDYTLHNGVVTASGLEAKLAAYEACNVMLRRERAEYRNKFIGEKERADAAEAQLAAYSQIAYSSADIAKLEEEARNLHDKLMWAEEAIRERDKRIAELEPRAKLIDAMSAAFKGEPYQSKTTRDISRAIANSGGTERTHGLMHYERYS